MKRDLSKNCLRGKPVPPALASLWAARDAGDDFVGPATGLTLLSSLEPLEERFGIAMASKPSDLEPTMRAHREVFERLGFFADDGDSGVLAFDLTLAPEDDPPVVHLDSEGQYEWLGVNLSEALVQRAAERRRAPAMVEWLRARGIEASLPGRRGTSTQFLPSIRDLHARLEETYGGQPRSTPAPATTAASADPATWFSRPGAEVAAALTTLLGGPPDRQWVECDAQGRVGSIWFHSVPATAKVRVQGIGFGDNERAVNKRLGAPHQRGDEWSRWAVGPAMFRVGYEDGVVTEIGFFAPT